MKTQIIALTALLMTQVLAVKAQNDVNVSGKDAGYIKPLFRFNPDKPMFKFTEEQAANANRLLRYYSLTGYREGVQPTIGQFNTAFGVTVDKQTGTRRIYMYNVSLVEMLTHFHDKEDMVVLEVKDPSKYRYLPEYGAKIDWMRKNAHCFELMVPEGVLKGRSEGDKGTIDTVLAEALGLNFNYEKRIVNGTETEVFVITEPDYKK